MNKQEYIASKIKPLEGRIMNHNLLNESFKSQIEDLENLTDDEFEKINTDLLQSEKDLLQREKEINDILSKVGTSLEEMDNQDTDSDFFINLKKLEKEDFNKIMVLIEEYAD